MAKHPGSDIVPPISGSVTTRMMAAGGMTYDEMQAKLTAAFNKVADKADWKRPIDAVIDRADRDIVREAVIYFTATVPTFVDVGDKMRVTSPGYRAGPAN